MPNLSLLGYSHSLSYNYSIQQEEPTVNKLIVKLLFLKKNHLLHIIQKFLTLVFFLDPFYFSWKNEILMLFKVLISHQEAEINSNFHLFIIKVTSFVLTYFISYLNKYLSHFYYLLQCKVVSFYFMERKCIRFFYSFIILIWRFKIIFLSNFKFQLYHCMFLNLNCYSLEFEALMC